MLEILSFLQNVIDLFSVEIAAASVPFNNSRSGLGVEAGSEAVFITFSHQPHEKSLNRKCVLLK